MPVTTVCCQIMAFLQVFVTEDTFLALQKNKPLQLPKRHCAP
ncbi:hypothetical protein Misp06_01539 [Microbulbifer sp. NBRC 101763]